MVQALNTGCHASDIIYANPCKGPRDIRVASRLHVPRTVVDSPEEVEKLAASGWKGSALIRLLVPDAGSAQPFSKKFGAPLSWVPEILNSLRLFRIPHAGWSFHVGSMCQTPTQFSGAIELCAAAHTFTPSLANPVVDVGGGFMAEEEVFAASAAEIRRSFKTFPSSTEWIAEPGRFMAAPTACLEVPVIGVKRSLDGKGFRYTVDESLYSAFSNIPFDGQRPTFELVDGLPRPLVKATLFGRTCDSADCLGEVEIPKLRVGDWLRIKDMGAYTMVSASEFNGFRDAGRQYLE